MDYQRNIYYPPFDTKFYAESENVQLYMFILNTCKIGKIKDENNEISGHGPKLVELDSRIWLYLTKYSLTKYISQNDHMKLYNFEFNV